MRASVLMLTCVIAVALASAQETPRPDGSSPPPGAALCIVEGTLVSALDGTAVRRMDVSLVGGTLPYGAGTDANGHFLFPAVDPGRYYLQAGGGRFPYQTYTQGKSRERGTALVLKPGDHVRGLLFRLTPGGVIAGTIYSEDGDPAVRAEVQILRVPRAGDLGEMQPVGGGQTDDLGQYRVFALPAGRYFVAASRGREWHPPHTNFGADAAGLPTFYPGTADLSLANPVDVGPGGEIDGIDVTLTEARGVRVRGRAFIEGMGPMPKRNFISLTPRKSRIPTSLYGNLGGETLDDKGDFELDGVPPGSYNLMSYSTNFKGANYFGSLPLDVTGVDIEGITLTLSRGTRLSGRLHTEHDAALDYSKLNIWLQPSDPGAMGGDSAQIKPDGTFVVENIYDGTYRLHVNGFPEEFYVKSAQLGGLDALGTDLTINHSQPPGLFDILLSKDGGRIDGTVLDEQKPVGGAIVTLVPNPPNRQREDLYGYKRTDDMGRFSLLGLPPGDYKLFAWPAEETVNWQDPEFLRTYEKSSTPVHVEEKKQQSVQLQLISPREEAQ